MTSTGGECDGSSVGYRGVYSDTPRVRACRAFLDELGLPSERIKSFSAQVSTDRSGDHVTVTYVLVHDDTFGGSDE